MSDDQPLRVLAFQEITTNPSFEIVKLLPPSLPGIEIIAHPEPLRAAYRPLLQASPQLLATHSPDVVVHIGLAADRDYFAVETGAFRDGYHQYPDVDRQVIPKAEVPKIWGKKSAERLDSTLDLEQVVELWRLDLLTATGAGRGGKKGKGGQKGGDRSMMDVRLSDDVGTYVCGLVYYASLSELEKKGDGKRNAVFLHVPPLSGEEELAKGRDVVVALIKAISRTL